MSPIDKDLLQTQKRHAKETNLPLPCLFKSYTLETKEELKYHKRTEKRDEEERKTSPSHVP